MQLLGDLTIVELCRASSPLHIRLATAMAAKCFAQLGATVFRLEPPGHDPLRDAKPLLPDGDSALFRFLSTNVKVVSSGDGGELDSALRVLVSRGLACAIVAEDDPAFAFLNDSDVPTVRLATWPEELQRECSSRPLGEFQIMALGGLLDMVGEPDREPLRIAGHQVAYSAGMSAFTAAMAAVMDHESRSFAVHARVSLVETAAWINWKAVAGEVQGAPVSRQGRKAEYQVLPCKDGFIGFIYTPSQYDRVAAMLDDPEARDPRFATRSGRAAHVEELMATARRWLQSRTREEVYAAARMHGVALGPVYDASELLTDEQYQARNFLECFDGLAGRWCAPTLPMEVDGKRFGVTPAQDCTAAELIGNAA